MIAIEYKERAPPMFGYFYDNTIWIIQCHLNLYDDESKRFRSILKWIYADTIPFIIQGHPIYFDSAFEAELYYDCFIRYREELLNETN